MIMNYLFKHDIVDWHSWGQIFSSLEAFAPLIKQIFANENLDFDKIEHCMPGTNAVFKVGSYVVKIFAPKESGMNTESDYKTELFGMVRANLLQISAPKVIAKGSIKDKYLFLYLIMENVTGSVLGNIESTFTYEQKIHIGQKLRSITNKLNTECEKFNNIDIIERELNNKRWSIFPDGFNKERISYLKSFNINDEVYVHGDLNPDNVIIDGNYNVHIIDFADSLIAPAEYELPAIVCELFCFDKAFMKGYFGYENITDITEKCFKGLLLHEFGSDIIRCNLGNLSEIDSLKSLKEKLYLAIDSGEQILDLNNNKK